ncbi:MAG: DUF3463 domain-containing protein, partial [Candidatus Solibacter usitatus]|nr:DUF3463 domain-containing protein [Candidatus Solibacter usitatus]
YGTESGNPKCANCMMHSGYEATAVNDTFGSWRGFVSTIRATFAKYPDAAALKDLAAARVEQHPWELVQIGGGGARERIQ